MRNKISLLPEETIIQIAAGEIIENPSSVIKELVENSIDAGSNRISIEIEDSGRSLIKVTDNGYGFSKEDLKIAFKRHTTSKIRSIEELNTSISLGFRGEALSSIANVSNVTVITKRIEDLIGTIVKLNYSGDIIFQDEIVTNNGTTIICENLFENIPVRKKYLDLKNYEYNKTSDIINRLALSHPYISMEYIKEDRLMIKTDRKTKLINNIYSVLGKNISENLNYIESKFDDFSIRGYISNNHLFRSNKNNQFLFVNNRSVIDREISRIIERQYQSIIPLNRYPVYVIYLDILPELVDVNIHPKKDIIKFTNMDKLEKAFNLLVSKQLLGNITVQEFINLEKNDDSRDIFQIFHKEDSDNISYEELYDKDKVLTFKDYSLDKSEISDEIVELSYENSINLEVFEDNFLVPNLGKDFLKNGYRYIGNLFNQYILLEDNIDKLLYILDQHAAHERVNYEKLINDYKKGQIPMQNLVSGFFLELTRDEFDNIINIKDRLLDIGIDLDEFGDNSIIIRSVPAYINNFDPEILIRDLINNVDFNTSVYDIDPQSLMKMACSASIKKGENLSGLEVNKLIAELRECEFPFTCPHGRPTIIKMSKQELDKEFFRIQRNG